METFVDLSESIKVVMVFQARETVKRNPSSLAMVFLTEECDVSGADPGFFL